MSSPRLAVFLFCAVACCLAAQKPAPTPSTKPVRATSDKAVPLEELTMKRAAASKLALFLFCALVGCLPAQEPAPTSAARAVDASGDKVVFPEELATKLTKAKESWTKSQETTKAAMLAAFDAEIAKLAKAKREQDAVAHEELVAAKERFVESGKMPEAERMRRAAGDYEAATSKARARYRADVRKVAEELRKAKLDDLAREQLATLARECPYQTDPATFAKGMVKIRDDCRKQFAKNHPKTDVWAITDQLTNLIERCEMHQVSATDLPREVNALRGSIGNAKAMKRENPNTEQLRALLKQLDHIMSPPREEQ